MNVVPIRSDRRVWQGIEADHPPHLRRDYAELRDMARSMLESRRSRFPEQIAQGRLDAAEAERQIAIFEEIAADWHWICTGEGEPAPLHSIEDRRDALDASLATIASVARRRRGFDDKLAHQAECVIALRWHLEPERAPITRFYALLTHEARRDAREAAAHTQ